MFNLSPKWNFPSNNHSQIIGIADSGVEMFKGTPIKSLAREICQNSLDARLDNAHPARLEFETFTITPKTIPDSSNLEDAFEHKLNNSASISVSESNSRNEAILALVALGYSQADAMRAVKSCDVTDSMTTDEILKLALKKMMTF